VVWGEAIGDGRHAIFVSRLVGGDHFELFNHGRPLSNPACDASRPDITFAGNPLHLVAGEDRDELHHVRRPLRGRRDGAAVQDRRAQRERGVGVRRRRLRARADLVDLHREPDERRRPTCQGEAIGTPFFLCTAGDVGARKLFADALAPSDVRTIAGSNPTSSSLDLHGLANPGGTKARVRFDFGTTTAYGSSTAPETLDVAVVPTPFDAVASGLANGSTIHFRAVAASGFTTVVGSDATVAIVNRPPALWVADPGAIRRRDLGRGAPLPVAFGIDEPATVTIALRKGSKLVRQATVTESSAGTFTATLTLRRLHSGRYVLHVTATDTEGASSDPVDVTLRIRR
jgi:hypothetical protein